MFDFSSIVELVTNLLIKIGVMKRPTVGLDISNSSHIYLNRVSTSGYDKGLRARGVTDLQVVNSHFQEHGKAMKTTLIALGVLAVLMAVFFGLNTYIYDEKQGDGGLVTDHKTATYFISGTPVHLGEGGVTYFGNEVRGDIDSDGDEDIAFLITHQPGGSGSFYYLAGAINEGGMYKGTNAMLIGDRIAPQTTEYKLLPAPYGARVIVNYADRNPGEPFTTQPSLGKSLYAKYSVDTNDFGEVVQNFEGESR